MFTFAESCPPVNRASALTDSPSRTPYIESNFSPSATGCSPSTRSNRYSVFTHPAMITHRSNKRPIIVLIWRSLQNPGFKVHHAFILDHIVDLDRFATDLAILHVRLTSHRVVQHHGNFLPTVRTCEEVFHLFSVRQLITMDTRKRIARPPKIEKCYMLHALRHSTGRRLENRFTALEVRLPCRLRMPSWDIRAWRCTTPRVALHFLKATHARTGTWLLHMPRWRKQRPSL